MLLEQGLCGGVSEKFFGTAPGDADDYLDLIGISNRKILSFYPTGLTTVYA
jgi:hypothetical protein